MQHKRMAQERMLAKELEKERPKVWGNASVRVCTICGRQGHDAAYCWQRVAAITEDEPWEEGEDDWTEGWWSYEDDYYSPFNYPEWKDNSNWGEP